MGLLLGHSCPRLPDSAPKLTNLQPRRRCRLACCSRALASLAAGSPAVWAEVSARVASERQMRLLASWLATKKPHLQRLVVEEWQDADRDAHPAQADADPLALLAAALEGAPALEVSRRLLAQHAAASAQQVAVPPSTACLLQGPLPAR